MALISRSGVMSRPLLRLFSSARYTNLGWRNRGIATAPPPHAHPNPGNFANRPHDELVAIGHKGGKKGGKARGGGFHGTNTEKQVRLSRNHRARRKSAEHEETELEAERRGRSHEPSVVPPGFEEWKTSV
ncbi:uncharacterized protein N7529_003108 [Penicillium soppii]|uniref:uncharacterized protein n=1 Tax=Penicillium soppii TaxID=69789 RepID=UPI002549BA31|nr:uncharacterized protein N7529_003108 [Penicillium soppii]KAJ5874678.1 hypothetical protein N7529_003108 [Penicillium soppii]